MSSTVILVETIAVIAALGALVWLAVLAATRATRLDRLNVRVDLAYESLIAALERRAVVARTIAAINADSPASSELADAATIAESAPRGQREDAENRLSVALASMSTVNREPALVAELADAQTRVTMARRFYNDAVRDARTLAGRRMVRWLHLGGHSKLPDYFEITERVRGGS
ncbi:NUDIX hydrolase [Gordonia sp. (in: high G+C Gram-positive bacteria)]|uniref:NUDIX hydrolase n=1 Tax=Gordonia sp. (in: high G+C Gram-positive bacteria) TaxID=84139 RepID=UPI003C7733CC